MTACSARGRASRLLPALLVACALVAACQSVPPVPTDRFHRLTEAAAPPVAVQEWTDGSIEVRELRAEGPYLDRAILFTREGQTARVEPYRYDFWIYAPPHLIQQHMIGRLRASRLAPTILEDDRGTDPAFVISGRIVRFEQTLGSGTAQSDVELELEVASAGQRRLLMRNTYRAVEPAADRSVDAFVQSTGRALDRIYAAFSKDLISIPSRSR
jgi:ABC-type uncharacterized transport system auxiliary subunit